MDPGSAAKTVLDGAGYVVLNTNDYPTAGAVSGSVIGNGLVFTSSFRQKYPLTQDIVSALIVGLVRVHDVTDPTKAYALMPAEFKKLHADPALFAGEWALCQPGFAQSDGTVTATGIADSTGAFTEQDMATAGAKSYVDNSLVEKAYQSLKLTRPTLPTRAK
jgi:hypothetical protein